jgi:NADH:ubiquinone oxidoreductase subunit E
MCEIRICMGSSCFSRGNAANLSFLREYLAARGLAARVITVGHLCEDLCSQGPNLIFDGVAHHAVDTAALRMLLDGHFGKGGSQ